MAFCAAIGGRPRTASRNYQMRAHMIGPALALFLALVPTIGGPARAAERVAPGAPGRTGTWEPSGKTGIGTAYQP